MSELSIPQLQKKLHIACDYVLIDDTTANKIVNSLTNFYMNSPPGGDPIISIREEIESNSDLRKIFKSNDINNIDITVENDAVSVSVDRDLTTIGPHDADRVIDGSYAKLGRLASEISQMAQDGEKIVVVNGKNIIRTGSKEQLMSEYKQRRSQESDSGPHYPKQPHRIAKRAIRGMLPYKTKSGAAALENIKIEPGNPYEGEPIPLADEDPIDRIDHLHDKKFVTLGEIAEDLGATPHWK